HGARYRPPPGHRVLADWSGESPTGRSSPSRPAWSTSITPVPLALLERGEPGCFLALPPTIRCWGLHNFVAARFRVPLDDLAKPDEHALVVQVLQHRRFPL